MLSNLFAKPASPTSGEKRKLSRLPCKTKPGRHRRRHRGCRSMSRGLPLQRCRLQVRGSVSQHRSATAPHTQTTHRLPPSNRKKREEYAHSSAPAARPASPPPLPAFRVLLTNCAQCYTRGRKVRIRKGRAKQAPPHLWCNCTLDAGGAAQEALLVIIVAAHVAAGGVGKDAVVAATAGEARDCLATRVQYPAAWGLCCHDLNAFSLQKRTKR